MPKRSLCHFMYKFPQWQNLVHDYGCTLVIDYGLWSMHSGRKVEHMSSPPVNDGLCDIVRVVIILRRPVSVGIGSTFSPCFLTISHFHLLHSRGGFSGSPALWLLLFVYRCAFEDANIPEMYSLSHTGPACAALCNGCGILQGFFIQGQLGSHVFKLLPI
jgi:hypothetical protein